MSCGSLINNHLVSQAVGHVLGCGWFFVADLNGLGMDTWAGEFNLQSDQATFVEKYTVSVYWAFVTVRVASVEWPSAPPFLSDGHWCRAQVTTVGYGDVVPVSNSERQFVIFCTFIGNLAFAYMIGKMTAMAARVNASGQQFTAKMDAVVRGFSCNVVVRVGCLMLCDISQNEFMRHHMLPKQLRKRIRAYYDTFWAHGIYFNERKILAELSFSLRRDVDFYLKREIILTVPFFQDADQNFIAELISMLDLKHCQAEELLIQEGEIGYVTQQHLPWCHSVTILCAMPLAGMRCTSSKAERLLCLVPPGYRVIIWYAFVYLVVHSCRELF